MIICLVFVCSLPKTLKKCNQTMTDGLLLLPLFRRLRCVWLTTPPVAPLVFVPFKRLLAPPLLEPTCILDCFTKVCVLPAEARGPEALAMRSESTKVAACGLAIPLTLPP